MTRLLSMLLLALPAVAADPPKAKAPGKGTCYAFLVGCAGYDKTELQPIKDDVTVNDVIEFKKALLATGFSEDHIVLMHDKRTDARGRYLPENAKIVKELDLFLDGLTKDDTVVVVLSGHGVHFKGDKTGYFCPVDAKISTKKNLLPMDGTGGLYPLLEKCKAGRKLLIANACRNDPASSTSLAGGKIELTDDYPETVPQGIAAIFSCDVGQKSYFDPDRKRSLFMLHLTEAWKTGGNLEDVFKSTDKTTRTAAITTFGEKQFPKVRRSYEGEWVIVPGVNNRKEDGVPSQTVKLSTGTVAEPEIATTSVFRNIHIADDGFVTAAVLINQPKINRYEVRLVDCKTGKTAITIAQNSEVVDASISQSGKQIALLNKSCECSVWDVATGKNVMSAKRTASIEKYDNIYQRYYTSYVSPQAVNFCTEHDMVRFVLDSEPVYYGIYNGVPYTAPVSVVVKPTRYVESYKGYVRVYSPDHPAASLVLDHTDLDTKAVFHPNGKQVISVAGKTLRMWNAKTGDVDFSSLHEETIQELDVAAGGKSFLTSAGMQVHLWEPSDGKKLFSLDHSGKVRQTTYSPDGSRLLTRVDKSVYLWDVKTGQKLHTFDHAADVSFAEFTRSGKRVLTKLGDAGLVTVWDAGTGDKLGTNAVK